MPSGVYDRSKAKPRQAYRRREKVVPADPVDDSLGFGGSDEPEPTPANPYASKPSAEIVALGMPPEDAAGIQKWNYRLLSTMAALAAKDETISESERMRRIAMLTQAAARHYPEAARYDLDRRLQADAEELAGKKRARAAAKMERRPPAGGAKVIPIRPDAPQD